jgi:hypothetical protein
MVKCLRAWFTGTASAISETWLGQSFHGYGIESPSIFGTHRQICIQFTQSRSLMTPSPHFIPGSIHNNIFPRGCRDFSSSSGPAALVHLLRCSPLPYTVPDGSTHLFMLRMGPSTRRTNEGTLILATISPLVREGAVSSSISLL